MQLISHSKLNRFRQAAGMTINECSVVLMKSRSTASQYLIAGKNGRNIPKLELKTLLEYFINHKNVDLSVRKEIQEVLNSI